MKILVVGGAGYVGSVLVPELSKLGYDVDVSDLMWFGNHLPSHIQCFEQDTFSITEQQLKNYDQVVFLGGISNDPMAEDNPALCFIGNSAASAYLCYLCRRAGVKRLIYASSCSVYGYSQDQRCDEDYPTVSNYAYGISKLNGEKSCLDMKTDRFSVIALRKGTVCGYSPRMRLDLVLNTMFKTATTENLIKVNNPAIWRPILSVQDAANAYIKSIQSDYSISGVFNIASGNFTVEQLANEVKTGLSEELGVSVEIQVNHIHDLRNYKVSCKKSSQILGFQASSDPRSIIKDLVNHKDKFTDFDNENYYNIKIFRKIVHSYKGTSKV